jgi:hypothetical protein
MAKNRFGATIYGREMDQSFFMIAGGIFVFIMILWYMVGSKTSPMERSKNMVISSIENLKPDLELLGTKLGKTVSDTTPYTSLVSNVTILIASIKTFNIRNMNTYIITLRSSLEALSSAVSSSTTTTGKSDRIIAVSIFNNAVTSVETNFNLYTEALDLYTKATGKI